MNNNNDYGISMKNLLLSASLLIAPIAAAAEDNSNADSESMQCMALNIYYEARNSNLADKAGVADVVMNRVYDTRYPNTICGVVQDGYKKNRRDCQFSWYCDGKADDPQDTDIWMEAQGIAYMMIEHGEFRGITEGATHYHATYVDPYWASSLQMVGTLGKHVYYRWDQ
jgi:N-acetylmuramoyl-L-alanine amidase